MKTLFPGRMKQVSISEAGLTEGLAGFTTCSVQSSTSANGKDCSKRGVVLPGLAGLLTGVGLAKSELADMLDMILS